MAKIFYDRLIKIEEVFVELDNYELSDEERAEFMSLIDETLHNHTLDIILSHLPPEYHEDFLSMFNTAPDKDELLDFLKKQSGCEIEKLITEESAKIKKDMIGEIKKAKKKR